MDKGKWRIRQIMMGVVLGLILFNLNVTSLMAQDNQTNGKTYKVMIDENIEIDKGFNINTITSNNRTLVPATKMYQSLGYTVEWHAGAQKMTATKGNIVITLKVGDSYGEKNYKNLNHKIINLDVPVKYINNDVYVTLGFISKSTGIVFSKTNSNIYAYDQTVAYYGNNAAERAIVKIATAGSYAQNKYNTSKRIICDITDPDMTDLEKLYEIIDYIYENSEYGMVNFHGGNKGYNEKSFDANFSVITHGVGDQGSFGQSAEGLISAADIKNSSTTVPGQIGWTWNIVQINGENYHIDLGRLLEEKYDSYQPFDKDHSYHGLFTLDSDKKKGNRFNILYENYSILKATSPRFKEISNTWYAARDGQWIFFNKFDDKPGFYKINIDGTGMTRIHEDTPFDLKIQGDWIYYRVFNYGIIEEKFYKIRKDGSDRTELPINPDANKYFVTKDNIYYSLDKIYKTDLDGKNEKVISQYPASRMRLDGEWIYYINAKDNDKLYKVNINDGTNKCVVNQADIGSFTIGHDFITYRLPPTLDSTVNSAMYWYNTVLK